MKTAFLGVPEAEKAIIYNAKLLACGAHYGFASRACQPYRPKTKGKSQEGYVDDQSMRAPHYLWWQLQLPRRPMEFGQPRRGELH